VIDEIFSYSRRVAAGLGGLVFLGTVASSVPASAKCMLDEGYGRYTSCEALYSEALAKQMKTEKGR